MALKISMDFTNATSLTIKTEKNYLQWSKKKSTDHTSNFPESFLFENYAWNGLTWRVNIGDAGFHHETDMCVWYKHSDDRTVPTYHAQLHTMTQTLHVVE